MQRFQALSGFIPNNFLPANPGNNASVIPATSIGQFSKYVQRIKPIDVKSSPTIGISMQGLQIFYFFNVIVVYDDVNAVHKLGRDL